MQGREESGDFFDNVLKTPSRDGWCAGAGHRQDRRWRLSRLRPWKCLLPSKVT